MKEISVRAARPEDAERIASLSGQLGYPVSSEKMRQRLAEIRDGESRAVYVAEERDGQVIGWIEMCVRDLLVSDRQTEIEGLVVDRGRRHRGAGRLLLEKAEKWAQSRGCATIYLRSNVIRKEARPFYEKQGYEVIKTQWAFRKVL